MKAAISFAALLFATISAAADTRVIFTALAGECTLSLEASPAWQTLRLRVHHPHYKNCAILQQDVNEMLASAMAKLAETDSGTKYTALALGRLIDYPYLSAYLAEAAGRDRHWNKKKGKPVSGDVNGYVARVLSHETVRKQFEQPLGIAGYKVISISVEKVLVGGVENVPFYRGIKTSARLPFDAQVWLKLQ
jgi:hypothetical protein